MPPDKVSESDDKDTSIAAPSTVQNTQPITHKMSDGTGRQVSQKKGKEWSPMWDFVRNPLLGN